MNRVILDPMTMPLQAVQLVEASAGTGKTWLIASVYVRLVLGHGLSGPAAAGRMPPEILVVTFTKAATAELRDRIRSRLTESAAVFRGAATPDLFLRALLSAYPDEAARASAARRLELAAQWMDEAAIFTIHAWCQRMLNRHAFDCRRPFEEPVTAEMRTLVEEACQDYWRVHCVQLSPVVFDDVVAIVTGPEALASEVRLWTETVFVAIEGGVEGQGSLQSLIGPAIKARAERKEALRGEWRKHLQDLEGVLPILATVCDGRMWAARHYAGWIASIRAWADGESETLELTDAAWNRLNRTGMTAALKKKDQPLPEIPLWDATDELRAMMGGFLEATRATLLRHALVWVRQHIARAKQSQSLMSFNDMLTLLGDALQSDAADSLSARIATEHPIALIDEFQDTDPIQWSIFRRVYEGRPNTGLLLIGDPKQAIYGFRGADIATYFAARETAEVPRHTLATNYRSTKSLVGAVNALFEYGEAANANSGVFMYGAGDEGLPFGEVGANGREERLIVDGDEVPALTLARPVASEFLGKGDYRDLMAEACAERIIALLNAGQEGRCALVCPEGNVPITAGDIAILVRSGSESDLVRDALRRRGLSSVYLSDKESVFSTQEARDMLLLLKAMASPTSDRALRAALATTTLARSYAELDQLGSDEAYRETLLEHLLACQTLWQRSGVLAGIRGAMHRFEIPARRFAAADGERAITNLLHLAELLQHDSVTLEGEQALIRRLEENIEDSASGEREDAPGVLRLETEADLIKVVTIHKSKGLEYPLVFLPFPCTFREADSPSIATRTDEDGTHLVFDVGPELTEARRLDTLREDMRLLYVALTRAKYHGWVGVAPIGGQGKDSSKVAESALGTLLGGGESLPPAAFFERLASLASPNIQIAMIDPAMPTTQATRTEVTATLTPVQEARQGAGARWWIGSYSKLVRGSVVDPESAAAAVGDEEGQAIEDAMDVGPLAGLPGGRTTGTFLHYLLEWAALVGFGRLMADDERLNVEVERRCADANLVPHTSLIQAWLRHFLATPIVLDPTTAPLVMKDATGEWCRPEFGFLIEARHVSVAALDALIREHVLPGQPRPVLTTPVLNGALSGFIDLVFCHDGRWWVADYKSNLPGDIEPAFGTACLEHLILHHRYDLQYVLYVLALHRFLAARLPDYDYDRHVGGAAYLFLRGMDEGSRGVFVDRPPRALIEQFDHHFASGGRAHAA